MRKRIEIWFSDPELSRRDFVTVSTMREALTHCKELTRRGCFGLVVDVTFTDPSNVNDLIEEKSRSYSFRDGKKLKPI